MGFSSDQPQVYNQLPISVDLPVDKTEFKAILTDLYKRIANSVNTKEGGLYTINEVATGQQYITNPKEPQKTRNVYRKTIDFGQLPNAGTKSVPHGIDFNSQATMTRIYGASTDPTALLYIPLPYATPVALNENIALFADGTNVTVITGINRSNFFRTTVVLEYMKNI